MMASTTAASAAPHRQATRHDPVAVVMPAMNTGAVAQPIARQAVHGERVADALGRHPLVQDGEVHRVEGRIAQAREQRGQQQHGVVLRRAGDHPGHDKAAQRGKQHRACAHPVHQKAGQRLPGAGDDEEQRHHHAQLRIAVAEVGNQPGKQRRQQQVEKVRGAMGQADQADGAASWRRSAAGGVAEEVAVAVMG
jgi:hypothetical protein